MKLPEDDGDDDAAVPPSATARCAPSPVSEPGESVGDPTACGGGDLSGWLAKNPD